MLGIAWTALLMLLAGAGASQAVAEDAPPASAGAFSVQRNGTSVTLGCAASETMRACADRAAALLQPLPLPTLPPAMVGSITPARPSAVNSLPDIIPSLWFERSATVDPTKLPLGNGRMTTDFPRKGSVFACDPFMYSMRTIIGARVTGPWVNEAAGTYDVTRKVFDRGRVEWAGTLSIAEEGPSRVIRGNGLPLPGVPTGIFPVPENEPAYRFDRNPNPISEQRIALAVPLHPTFGPAPRCVYKEVGITLDGVALHTGLDSSGRDENGYELNDTCNGKPQPGGGYHRHAPSECTPGIREPRRVVGYALDGFPITGPFEPDGSELTTDDLDECHGSLSEIAWDGQRVTSYHYVLTRDFPYSVACFRGTPTRNAFPPLPGAPPQLR